MPSPRPPLSFLAPHGRRPEQPLFVFLPGMDGTGELFDTQLGGLINHFDVRCLVIPGDDMSSWGRMVAAVLDLIRGEANRAPIYLCGESFGACLALQVAAQAPSLISHLVLVNPASSFHRLPWFTWVSSVTPWLAPSIYRASTMGTLPLLAALNRISEANRMALLRAMRSVSQPSAAWRLTLLAQFRAESLNLKQLSQPTLLVAGQQDRLLPSVAEVQRLATYLSQAQILTLPLSGHTCLLEEGVSLGKLLGQVGWLPPVPALATATHDS